MSETTMCVLFDPPLNEIDLYYQFALLIATFN